MEVRPPSSCGFGKRVGRPTERAADAVSLLERHKWDEQPIITAKLPNVKMPLFLLCNKTSA